MNINNFLKSHQYYIRSLLLLIFVLASLLHQHANAQTTTTPSDIDEAFDPFSDYNEFEQDADEEADINFFKNGRMLTLGLQLGYRGYTDGFSQAYTGAGNYGVTFTYFFDLQLALAMSYVTGDSNVEFTSHNTDNSISHVYTGNVNIQILDVSAKYYFNTENVTRGLADLNPYVSFGAAYFVRTYSLSEQLAIDPDKVFGIKSAIGIEIPLLRRKAYLGFQAAYHYVQFPDENKLFIEETKAGSADPVQSPVSPRLNGDIYDISAIIGVNF